MEKSEREKRTEKMLKLIEQRLSHYTVDEVIEKLHSYESEGPTVHVFLESIENKN